MKTTGFVSLMAVVLLAASALAAEPAVSQPEAKFKSLDELLKHVRESSAKEDEQLKQREAEFVAAADKQKSILTKALAAKKAEEDLGRDRERAFEANETRIAELDTTLKNRLGAMGELFGVIRQMAGDTAGVVENSIVSTQYPGRQKLLRELAESKTLPSVKQLEDLWFAMQQEATESGKVARFPATVVLPNGNEEKRDVVRIGTFNMVSRGEYLQWLPEVQKLRVFMPQPASSYVSTIAGLESAKQGFARFAVDPSRGSVLSLLVLTPTWKETLDAGGFVGYVIMVLAAIAFIIALVRMVQLFLLNRLVRRQEKNPRVPASDNPLGRVLQVYQANRTCSTETLELKLDEAIGREQTSIERSLWLINVVAVVAPLLGLLGTITGMIRTFQAIVLFGTGDPKMMASGISEALVTTMQGLVTAIPLVLLYSWLKSITKRILEVLDGQSIGLLAGHEDQGKKS